MITFKIKHKPVKPRPQAGDTRYRKVFLYLPKGKYDCETNTTTYYWLCHAILCEELGSAYGYDEFSTHLTWQLKDFVIC